MEIAHILLVEDNEGDILLTKEAFEEAKVEVRLSIARNGKEAMDFLDHQLSFNQESLPDLILLDVNLPLMNGHEVLQYIKGHDQLKHIPVIMLTTSSAEKDINLAYSQYVNCYVTKPVDVNLFLQVVTSIERFWISVVRLPGRTDSGNGDPA